MFLLNREDIQKMAYQSYEGVDYSYGHEEKMLKSFNRKIIRNYIISALLGAAITTQAFLATRNPLVMKKILLADAVVIFGASVIYTASSIIKTLMEEKKEQKSVY